MNIVNSKKVQQSNALRCVVCTTVKLPDFGCNVIHSFVRYHLKIGFKHVYIFFDDINDGGIKIVKKQFSNDEVTIILNDDNLKSKWKTVCPSYESLTPYIEDEVQARQRLNCEVALNLAYEGKYDWLLHIDSDELFYMKNSSNIQSHFQKLNDGNIGQMTYLNFEGVPEELYDGSEVNDEDVFDYFKNVTLFRKHHSIVNMNQQALESMKYWEQRRNHGQYFLAYDIGKSAVRVLPNVKCTNVHKFTILKDNITPTSNNDVVVVDDDVKKDSKVDTNLKSCTAIIDARNFNFKNYFKMEDTIILHYVVCGFPWLQAKYEILGSFPNSWYGGKIPIAPSFHRDARDLILNKKNAMTVVKKFYKEQIMLNTEKDIDLYNHMIESGVCVRISKPSKILKNHRNKNDNNKNWKQRISTTSLATNNPIFALIQSVQNDTSNNNNNKNNKEINNTNSANGNDKNEDMTYDKNWMIANAVKKFL